MRTVFETRASTVLYRLAVAVRANPGVFLIPANVCPSVPLALAAARRDVEFLDLDPGTLCIDPGHVEARLRARSKPTVAGIVFVRTYGFERNSSDFFRGLRALSRDVLVVDDRCLGPARLELAEDDLQHADAVVFSTGHAKAIDLGYGGFAHLRSTVPYALANRDYDRRDLEKVTGLCRSAIAAGRPLCMSANRQEALMHFSQYRWLDTSSPQWTWSEYMHRVEQQRGKVEARRQRINAIYERHVPASVRLGPGFDSWRFQLRAPDSHGLLRKLFAAGFLASAHHYPASRLFGGQSCPVAETLSTQIVNLFNDLRISEGEAEKIGCIVAAHLDRMADEVRA